MPNYQEMYLTMFRAAEKTVRILQETQLKCEELYMEESETTVIRLVTEEYTDSLSEE